MMNTSLWQIIGKTIAVMKGESSAGERQSSVRGIMREVTLNPTTKDAAPSEDPGSSSGGIGMD